MSNDAKLELTEEGHERFFAIDYLCRFVGVNFLIPLLHGRQDARVHFVFAAAHPAGKLDFDDLEGKKIGNTSGLAGIPLMVDLLTEVCFSTVTTVICSLLT